MTSLPKGNNRTDSFSGNFATSAMPRGLYRDKCRIRLLSLADILANNACYLLSKLPLKKEVSVKNGSVTR
jgi:hypothetical protein